MNSINVPDDATEVVRKNMELWKKGQVEILLFISQRLARLREDFSNPDGKRVQKEMIVVRQFEPFVVVLTLDINEFTDAFTATIKYTDDPDLFKKLVRLNINRHDSVILTSYLEVAKVMASGATLFRDATREQRVVLSLNGEDSADEGA